MSCALEPLESGAIRVALDGELDVGTAPEADRALRAAQAGARLTIVDLRRVEFIGATAVRVLLAADTRARHAGGQLHVVPTPTPDPPLSELAQLYEKLDTREQRSGEHRDRQAA